MEMASSKGRTAGPLRRSAARALAWSRDRWGRMVSKLGSSHARAALRLPLLLVLFALGLGAGWFVARWSGSAGNGAGMGLTMQSAPAAETSMLPVATSRATTAESATRPSPLAPAAGTTVTGGRAGLQGRLVWPADGMVVATAGWRRHPEQGDWRYLPGLELAVPSGAPVRASGDGRVSAVEAGADGFTVVIDHGGEWQTVYGRLARVRVQQGQEVAAGTVVGYGPSFPEAVPALAGLYGVSDVAGTTGSAATVRGVVSFAIYHGTESVDPLGVMPAGFFRVAEGSEPLPALTGSSDLAIPSVSPVGP
ncbi:MAG TPA: M23 family metallopeptidase [Limnochordales bacterium]